MILHAAAYVHMALDALRNREGAPNVADRAARYESTYAKAALAILDCYKDVTVTGAPAGSRWVLAGGAVVTVPSVKGNRHGIKKMEAWLLDTAREKARRLNEDWILLHFAGEVPGKMTRFSVDSAHDYIFRNAHRTGGDCPPPR